ncbi:MAG: sporulation protein YhbH, partial [Clostridiales bacterium GWC2_40_7]
MAIFKEYDSGGKDRSAEDRRRHKELVEESIKKNIGNIIAEESIIGQSRNKKIKIPIKGIKEYRFVYGKNSHGAGSGDGTEKRGDVIGQSQEEGKGSGGSGAGDAAGEDIYETEITIEELINYLFDDLNLPDIDKKKLSEVESEKSFRNLGYQKKGIPPRLAKKRSVVEKIKRKQALRRVEAENGPFPEKPDMEEMQDDEADMRDGGRFPFTEDDLRYHRVKETRKKEFNAVVICIMDVSGSMDQTKKYMARSFYFLLYQFVRLKYANVEVVFVAHTTEAKEVGETEFFHKGESGGTYISSGYEKALEIIEQRYNPESWNIYAFHCSDGDNWTEDNKKAIELAGKLCEVCNLFGYGEIVPGSYLSYSTIKSEFVKNIKSSNFAIV